jgi:hypothetical protein
MLFSWLIFECWHGKYEPKSGTYCSQVVHVSKSKGPASCWLSLVLVPTWKVPVSICFS